MKYNLQQFLYTCIFTDLIDFYIIKGNLNLKGVNTEFDSILNEIDDHYLKEVDDSPRPNDNHNARGLKKHVMFDDETEENDSLIDLDAFESADEDESIVSKQPVPRKAHPRKSTVGYTSAADSKPPARPTSNPILNLSPTSKLSPNPNHYTPTGLALKSYEPFQHDDIHVVNEVKYSYHIAEWMDNKYNKMVSLFIHLPSGINPDDIHVKVKNGGMMMSFYQKVPAIFRNSFFIMEKYQCGENDARVVSIGDTINKERLPINQGLCDDIYYEMKIDLPFSCHERPISVKKGGTYRDVDMFRFKHDNPELRKKGVKYLGCFIDLCALNKNLTRARYAVGRSN